MEECDINLGDFPFICRICLKRSKSRLFKAEDYLLDVFLTITKINVRSTANLPKNICKDCIKTLEHISLFIDTAKNNYAKSRKNVMPKNENEQIETAKCGTSQKLAMKSEEYVEDLQYFKGFEICRICYSTNILKPVEEIARLMQLFQSITNIVVEDEVAFSNRNCICTRCINELETISLFLSVSLSNEMKLKNTIERCEALEVESKSLHTIIDIKEDIVDTPEQINRNVFSKSCPEKNQFDYGPCKDEFGNGAQLKTPVEGLVINNLKNQSGTKQFKCEGCDKSFTLKKNLKAHVFTFTKGNPFKCDYCDKMFTHKCSLQQHLTIHTGEKKFKCDCCRKKSFNSKSNLQRHVRIHHREKKFKCDFCERSFAIKTGLKKHLFTHTGEELFKCDSCKKNFTKKRKLRLHVLIHAVNKKFKCDFCERSFSFKFALEKHLPIHTGERPFKCDFCEKSFTTKWYLQQHVLIHTREKKFQCEFCEKSFTYKIALKGHLLIHTGERPFVCHCCEKSCTSKGNLKKHMLIHSREKKCDFCERTFTLEEDLKRHLLVHTVKRPFKCDGCKKSFTTKGNLKQHIATFLFKRRKCF